MSHKDVSFEIGEIVITLAVDEVKKRYGIDQGFGFHGKEFKPFICRVIKKDFLWGVWMIIVEPLYKSDETRYMSGVWHDQYIFDPYIPIMREERLSKLLDKNNEN